jgi:hypothetical protein
LHSLQRLFLGGHPDSRRRRQNLLILKKPFDFAEAAQMALAWSEKGLVTRKSPTVKTLEEAVERGRALAEVTRVSRPRYSPRRSLERRPPTPWRLRSTP